MKAKLLLLVRIAVLAVLYLICFVVVSAALIPQPAMASTESNAARTLLALLAVSVLNTLVLAYVILRSRLAGWKLSLNLFIVLFGVSTFMSQIETAVFVTRLPPGMLRGIVLSGLVFWLIFCPLAVLILGKHKNHEKSIEPKFRLQMPVSDWLLRLSIIAVSYVIIYFTFGYFIAWKSPAVRAYYGGTDSGNFFTQMAAIFRSTPWLPLFQFGRGLLWVALAVPLIRMTKGQWWEAGLAVTLCFGVLTTSPLLIPNPIMPAVVRMVHLVETTSSNFLFGWLVVFVLVKWRHRAFP